MIVSSLASINNSGFYGWKGVGVAERGYQMLILSWTHVEVRTLISHGPTLPHAIAHKLTCLQSFQSSC